MNGFSGTVDKTRRLGAVASAGLVLAIVGLGLAACGGNNEPTKTVATLPANTAGPSASASAKNQGNPVAYAQCMRANGVQDFPDPDQNGTIKLGEGGKQGPIDPDSSAFKAASEKCKQYMGTGIDPNKGSNQQADPWPADKKLAYSKCMRANGLPNFPDPDQSGQFPHTGANKVDIESPEFKKADKACTAYKPQQAAGGAGAPGGGGA